MMNVASICAEYAPWCRTGGLGDVTGALPRALLETGEVWAHATFLPLYRETRSALLQADIPLRDTGIECSAAMGSITWQGRWYEALHETAGRLFLLQSDPLFDGPGPYEMTSEIHGPKSLAQRFGFFCVACVQDMAALMDGAPNIVHLHDWHVAPIAHLLSKSVEHGAIPTVLTIHNLAYQGWFPSTEIPEFAGDEDEHISFLRLGILAADVVTTVSERYSREICTSAFGCGLDEVLSRIGVVGILNGVDEGEWNPETDPFLRANYSAEDRGNRALCRDEIRQMANWSADETLPVFGIVSRLDYQKGLDWVETLIPELPTLGARLVLLGTGDSELEARFKTLAARYPEHFAAWIRFDVAVAHQIFAGVDAFLVPSRFEPCGLTQLYAMRYGALPIVNPVGGLADTVTDPNQTGELNGRANGLHMASADETGLRQAIERALHLWHHDRAHWREMTDAGFAFDSSWVRSGRAYLRLFQSSLKPTPDRPGKQRGE